VKRNWNRKCQHKYHGCWWRRRSDKKISHTARLLRCNKRDEREKPQRMDLSLLLGLWVFRVSPDLLTHYSRGSHPSDHRFRKPQVHWDLWENAKVDWGIENGNLVYGWWCSGEVREPELGFRPTSLPIVPEGPPHQIIIGFRNSESLGSLRRCKSELGDRNWEPSLRMMLYWGTLGTWNEFDWRIEDVVKNFGNIQWNNHSCQALWYDGVLVFGLFVHSV
jgi:hypothetical protein